MPSSSSFDYHAQQQDYEEKLSTLLYKEGYCFCIPNIPQVQALLQKINKPRLSHFLMKKNPMGLSVVSMFLLILIKNKQLKSAAYLNLVDLIRLLLSHLEITTIGRLVLEKTADNLTVVHSLIYALLQAKPSLEGGLQRSQALTKGLNLLLANVSSEVINKLVLDPFNVLGKLINAITYTRLYEERRNYFIVLAKILINRSDRTTIDSSIFQIQTNGFSFMWCNLARWLEKIDEPLAGRIGLENLATLITLLLDKATIEKLPSLLWEKEGDGFSLILAYTLLMVLPLAMCEKEYLSAWYLPWLEKLFLMLSREQGECFIRKTFEVLMDNTRLSQQEKQKLESQFFNYLLQFSNLASKDYAHLKCLRKQLASEFFPLQASEKRLSTRQVWSRSVNFFRQCFYFQTSEAPLELSERSALLKHN